MLTNSSKVFSVSCSNNKHHIGIAAPVHRFKHYILKEEVAGLLIVYQLKIAKALV